MNSDQLNGLKALKAVAEKKVFTRCWCFRNLTFAHKPGDKTVEEKIRSYAPFTNHLKRRPNRGRWKILKDAGPATDQILQSMNNIGTYAESPSGVLRLNLPRIVYPNILEPMIADEIKSKKLEVALDQYDCKGDGF